MVSRKLRADSAQLARHVRVDEKGCDHHAAPPWAPFVDAVLVISFSSAYREAVGY
jgi:hypothetical protein